MFQNIVDEMQDKNEEKIHFSVRISEILKNIFKYQNVIIYLLTLCFHLF